MGFLQTNGRDIVKNGKPITLNGVGLGGWQLLEDFMVGFPGTDWQIRHWFKEILGEELRDEFFHSYSECHLREEDIKNIKDMGFNLVRMPFNYRYFESDLNPFEYFDGAFDYLDKLFSWCKKHEIYILLDFHALPGGQNTTPPSDNVTGYPLFWSVKHFQDRCVALWETLAERYKDEEFLFGYDLINEPITTSQISDISNDLQTQIMNDFYARLIAAIRKIDPDHCIVIEGNVRQSGGIHTLRKSLITGNPNMVASFHFYPLFQYVALDLSILKEGNSTADVSSEKEMMRELMIREEEYVQELNCPMLLGEFGFFNDKDEALQTEVVTTQMEVIQERGWHWCVWPYKDIGVMGLVHPKKESFWRKFLDREDLQNAVETCEKSLREQFEVYVETFNKTKKNELYFDAACNEIKRGKNRMELLFQMEKLSECSKEEIRKMPEAFLLENCETNEYALKLLQRFMEEK